MAKKEDLKKKKIKELLVDLNKSDEGIQIEAVKALKTHGDESVINPLVQVLAKSDSDALIKEIKDLLNTVKSTAVPKEVALCLLDDSVQQAHQALLSSIWNTGLDYRPYLKEIMHATLQGDLMEAIECITIIENQEGAYTEEQLFEPIIMIREYLVANKDNSDPKMEILIEIAGTLQQMNNNL